MIPTRPIPRLPSFLPETLAYRDNVFVGAGGDSITQPTLQAIDRFVRDCMNIGVWSKLTEIYPLCGTTFVAALVKLKYTNTVLITANNFTFADYAETGANGGLLGNGATKYLDLNFPNNSLGATGHVAAYLREDNAGVNYLIGANDAGVTQITGIANGTGSDQTGRFGGTAAANSPGAMGKGFYQADRSTATRLDLYKNGVSVANSGVNTTPSFPAIDLFGLARNNNGAAVNFLDKRLAFLSVGASMTSVEALAYFGAVQRLQSDLIRNV